MAFYLDTSALTKLVTVEAESGALRAWLAEEDRELISSDVARTELVRATRRLDALAAPTAKAVLDVVGLIPLSAATFEAAGLLTPPDLGSLDALHLAAALALGDDLEGFVTYDVHLARAAAGNGLVVLAPGSGWVG